MKERATNLFKSLVQVQVKLTPIITAFLLSVSLQTQISLANDTLAIRAFYVENYSYGSLDGDIGAGFALPPSNFAWRQNRTTHTIMFGGSGDAGMFSQTSPYWGPVVSSSDSASLISGNTGQAFWRWWRDSTHMNGGYLIQSFNAVNSTNFDFVAADSIRSETFWRAFIMWAIRNEVDGGDLDAESSTQSAANRTRFFRIGRRLGYNATWQSYIASTGKPGFRRGGKMIIGNALFMMSTNWMSSSADSTIDFFDLQAYNYQNMWGGSSNRPWYQTPWAVPAGQACGTCEAQGLNYGFSSRKNLIQEWVDAGWTRSKIVVGFSPSAVTVYTGTSAFGTGTPSGTQTDWARQDFERLTSFGGTKTYNSTAKATYISGTATGGGLSGAFVGSYTDSTSLKAICDSLYKVGAGGIMLYAIAKDVATLGNGSNHALDYYRTPTISGGSAYAGLLNGNGLVPPAPAAPTAATIAASSITQTTATLNGTVSANGAITSVRFVYGTASGLYTDSISATESPIPSGSSSVSNGLTGLAAATTYFYRARAYNSLGNSQGSEVTFTTNATASAPTATTSAATNITQTGAVLNGTVNANGSSTTVRFVWGTVSGVYTDSALAAQSPVAGTGISVTFGSSGFNAGTTYFYRVRATNSQGSAQGSEISCTTLLPGGQGIQDITAQGNPVALITAPTGEGNHDIEVMRDGITPPVGSTDVLQQYDTFTGGAPRSFDWIGLQFASTRSFAGITYQEGLDNQWGGCFVALQVQVRSGGVWTDVQNLVSNPPYASNNYVNYETYELSFNQVSGDAIRIAGVPTGSAQYIGVGELRVFEAQSVPPSPTLMLPANASTNQPITVALNWRSVVGASLYHVQVATDSSFTTTIVNDSSVVDSARQLSALQFLTKYYWRVRARNVVGYSAWSYKWNFMTRTQTDVDEGQQAPKAYSLAQNYPNPFNPSTTISFALPNAGRVRLTIYNLLGQQIAILLDTDLEVGTHTARFDASDLTSGVYIYRLEAGSFVETKKLVLLK